MSEYYYGARTIHFTMEGKKHIVNSPKSVSKEELEAMLFHVRRMLGYVVYPRWFTLRIFLSETIEMLKKNNLYKHEVKNSAKKVLQAFDELDNRHRRNFDQDFIEVMAGNLTGKSLSKVNDIRGSIGGVLMNHGIKKYILYSYPYTLVNLCFDNVQTYNFALKQVMEQYEIDFSNVFMELRGDKAYLLAIKLMSSVIKAVGEDISGVSFKDSSCLDKIEALNNIMSNENNLRGAFKEAFDEMPEDSRKKIVKNMSLWEDETNKFIDTLSQKYNVKKVSK